MIQREKNKNQRKFSVLIGVVSAAIYICIGFFNVAHAAPTVSTSAATGVNATFATGNGSLDDLGGATITQSGFLVSTDANSVLAPAAPVSQWKMNDNAGNKTVTDSVGSHNGTSVQNTSSVTTTGNINAALNFTAASHDFVTLPATADYDLQTFTIAAWVYSDNFNQNGFIFEKTTNGSVNTQYSCFFQGGTIYFRTHNSVGAEDDLSVTLANAYVTNSAWNHLVCRYDGSKKKIFINGVERATKDYSQTLITNPAGTSIIGAYGTGNGYYFNGKIDDVRIYGRSLNQSEINLLYNSGAGTEESGGSTSPSTYNKLGSRSGTGSFSSSMGGLTPNTFYYIRSYVTDSSKTSYYGSDQTFTTSSSGYATWDGSESTNWGTAGNWSTDAVPDSNTEVIIDGNYSNAPTLDLYGGSVTVKALSLGVNASSALTLSNGEMNSRKLISSNAFYIGSGGTLTHTANSSRQTHVVSIEAADFTIALGGKIDLSSKGYSGSEGPGQGGDNGSGGGCGGGGYGGVGGKSVAGNAGGPTYGNIIQPVDLGSGGGAYYSGAPGAPGGGAVKLNISGVADISGSILANGETGDNLEGSGAGGSIWISTGTLTGTGTVYSKGGSAATSNDGSGGGGRIALYYTTDISSLTLSAAGGSTGNGFGGAGTIFKKSASQSYGDLLIDNGSTDNSTNDRDYGKTPLNSAITLDTLTIQNYGNLDLTPSTNITYSTLNWSTNGVIADDGGVMDLISGGGNLTIPSGARLMANTARKFTGLTVNGTLTHSNNSTQALGQVYKINYTVSGDATVGASGSINVNQRGYMRYEGPGKGGAGGGFGNGGGSYGGRGGNGGGGTGGSTYGSLTEPADIGSGSGRYYNMGADGGGAVKLSVSGTMTVSGSITATGQSYYGGGSGGGVWIVAGTLSGAGSITANGGAGSSNDGAGGGGRIAIYYDTNNSSLSLSAAGGTGGPRIGQEGTIYFNGEFVSTIDTGNGSGTDYTSLSSWQNNVHTDLTLPSIKVFGYSNSLGSISDGNEVTGATSGYKGNVVHKTASKIMVRDIRKTLTGTPTFTNGSSAVTGSGTSFTTQVAVNDYIWLNADSIWVQVSAVTDNTHITLSGNYSGTGGSSAGSVRKSSFTKGEQVQVDGSNYVTTSDSGYSPIAIAKCRNSNGAADTSPVTIDGWGTSSSNYVKIWADPADSYRHAGRWDDTKYRLEPASGSTALRILDEYVKVEGLQIKLTASSADSKYGIEVAPDVSTNSITISQNIIKGVISGTSTGNAGIYVATTQSATNINNNVIYDFINSTNEESAIKIAVAGNHYLSYNTEDNCYNGYYQTAGTVVARNNIAQDSNDGFNGTFDGASGYNISDLAADASGTGSKNEAVVNFIDKANDDFRLANADTTAKNSGINLNADANAPVNVDVKNESRTGTPDIGAEEGSAMHLQGGMRLKGGVRLK